MSLQTTVNRAYTTGFQGQIVRDGPKRGRVARIASATVGTDPAASTNRMSRAFGYAANIDLEGSTIAAEVDTVNVGGSTFYGILGHPERYALYGSSGNSLAPSIDLPQGAEGEFYDMVTGMVIELFNNTTASYTANFGDQLCYMPAGVSTTDNPVVLPYGGLFSIAAGASAPAGTIVIPNARIVKTITIGASADGAPVSALTIAQLTQ
jgi:hypothetical protein